MMEPKDRVKLNVYKRLLDEEKKKNKKLVAVGASMFVIGIFSDNVFQMATETVAPREMKVAYQKATPKNSNNDIVWESFFEGNVVKEKNLELNAEDLFVADLGI